MVLVPVSGHAPQPLNTKLNSSDAVARVRQYRAVLMAILPGERAGRDLRTRLRTISTQPPGSSGIEIALKSATTPSLGRPSPT